MNNNIKFVLDQTTLFFAPIFYLNCEHVLFVSILKQRRKKICGFLKTNFKKIWMEE